MILFELACGMRVAAGPEVVAALLARGRTVPDPGLIRPSLPGHIREAIVRATRPAPDARVPSARALADVLAGVRPETPTAVDGTRPTVAWSGRARARTLAAVAAVVLLAGIGGYSWTMERRAPSPAAQPVVAVLPFSNLTGDGARDYLAAGFAESLTSRLTQLSTVTVISRAATLDARRRTSDLRALARELDATFLVDGSLQSARGALQVTLNLVRPDGQVAWSDSFTGPVEDLFTLQATLASGLSTALAVKVSASERAELGRASTRNAEALAEYWRGRALLDRVDVRGNAQRAVAGFSHAIERDPEFAVAYAALGEALWRQYVEERRPELANRATEAGLTALRLDPDSPEVRYVIAVTYQGLGRRTDAIEEARRALALRPRYDDARALLGQMLILDGKVDDGMAEYQKALAVRPNFRGHYAGLGRALFDAGRYEDAARAFRKVVELQPDNALVHRQLGAVYQSMGRTEEAVAEYGRRWLASRARRRWRISACCATCGASTPRRSRRTSSRCGCGRTPRPRIATSGTRCCAWAGGPTRTGPVSARSSSSRGS